MKIRQVHIERFKGISDLELKFYDEYTNEVRPVTAIFGDNASGKTSVLQAIALIVSLATRKIPGPDGFQWHGFLMERLDPKGQTKIQVQLERSDAEIKAVQQLYQLWSKMFSMSSYLAPSNEKFITLTYENGQIQAEGDKSNQYAFLGRYYLNALLRVQTQMHPNLRDYFDLVGDVFWFDQYRNLGQGVHTLEDHADKQTHLSQITWKAGIEGLRKHLVGWWIRSKLHPSQNLNYIERLEERFIKIFPGVKFEGAEPMHDLAAENDEYYFLLSRMMNVKQPDGTMKPERRSYDFSEMSSGEQNIFSLLYEFIRLQISHSIVLIDELELHLHPPEQQALYSALRHFGDNCQFIFTSHSPYLSESIPDEYVHRLPGGRLWL